MSGDNNAKLMTIIKQTDPITKTNFSPRQKTTCSHTMLTGNCLTCVQLRELVGLTCFHLPFESFYSYSFGREKVEMLDIARNDATTQVITKIELWKNSNDTNMDYLVNDVMNGLDFRLKIVPCHYYFNIYKSKAIYSIHYTSNKFGAPSFLLIEFVILYL